MNSLSQSRFNLAFFIIWALSSTSWSFNSYADIEVFSKYSFFSGEDSAHLILLRSGAELGSPLSVRVLHHEDELAHRVVRGDKRTVISFPLQAVPTGTHLLIAEIRNESGRLWEKYVEVTRLPAKANEVKIDLETGGLIVDGLPFIPFGFYCSTPLGDLPEQEVVRGFNTIGPYQLNLPEGLPDRKAYMDRCAQLGLKVHYGLNSLVGSGHDGHESYQLTEDQKLEMLRQEVLAFRDHPALLAWYINDEPIGQGRPLSVVQRAYDLVKELDPHHPASIVFVIPERASEFRSAVDIAMTDPYPVPGPLDKVKTDVDHLVRHFAREKAIWLVPQAFGGGENWTREPTAAEIRAMTYIGLVQGAAGIQYFIRRGPNLFPKSVLAWNECSAIAHEVAEMTPWLLSGEVAPEVEVEDDRALVRSWTQNGEVLLIAVNMDNEPKPLRIRFPEGVPADSAWLPFENRRIALRDGRIDEHIEAHGTRIYLLGTRETPDARQIAEANLMVDPSFELSPSPGVPQSCYASYAGTNGDPGATYFTDSRVALHGRHSLRLNSPGEGTGIALQFFPLVLEGGSSYLVSVWAKSGANFGNPDFRLSMPALDKSQTFATGQEWRQYRYHLPVDEAPFRPQVRLELTTAGTAWFDLLEVRPDPLIGYDIASGQLAYVQLSTEFPDSEIRFTLDGTAPVPRSRLYRGNLQLNTAALVRAGVFVDGVLLAENRREVPLSSAFGKKVEFLTAYSPKYPAAGEVSLTDGVLGSRSFRDGQWLGYEAEDAVFVVDLGEIKRLSLLELGYLDASRDGIHPPAQVAVSVSSDGVNFRAAGSTAPPASAGISLTERKTCRVDLGNARSRYVKVEAVSIGSIPEGYLFKGSNAWTFLDEVLIK